MRAVKRFIHLLFCGMRVEPQTRDAVSASLSGLIYVSPPLTAPWLRALFLVKIACFQEHSLPCISLS